MADSLLQQQLDEVRLLLQRARDLFSPNPAALQQQDTPPDDGSAR